MESLIKQLMEAAKKGQKDKIKSYVEAISEDLDTAINYDVFFELPIRVIGELIRERIDTEFLAKLVEKFSTKKPEEAPKILNYLHGKDFITMDEYIQIIGSLKCSKFCLGLAKCYRDTEQQPAVDSLKQTEELKEKLNTAQKINLAAEILNPPRKPEKYEEDLFKAIEKDDLNSIRHSLENMEKDVETKNEQGQTPMLFAASRGNLLFVQYFIEYRKANINAKDVYGNSCIHLASKSGDKSLVAYLVQKYNVNIEERNNIQWTPLIVAADSGKTEVVEYLIDECHADINASDGEETALHRAVSWGYVDIVKILSKKVNKIDSSMMELTDDDDIKQILRERRKRLLTTEVVLKNSK